MRNELDEGSISIRDPQASKLSIDETTQRNKLQEVYLKSEMIAIYSTHIEDNLQMLQNVLVEKKNERCLLRH